MVKQAEDLERQRNEGVGESLTEEEQEKRLRVSEYLRLFCTFYLSCI